MRKFDQIIKNNVATVWIINDSHINYTKCRAEEQIVHCIQILQDKKAVLELILEVDLCEN